MYESYLVHYGTIGMKWGQRRSDISNKLEAIKRTGDAQGTTDAKRFKYLSKPLAVRAGKNFAVSLAATVAIEMLTGNINKYQYMSKAELAKSITKKVVKLGLNTAVNVAEKDAFAKNALKRYNSEGQRLSTSKKTYFTKTDALEQGVKLATKVIPIIVAKGTQSITRDQRQKFREKQAFEKWGANILPEKVNNIVWQSKDLDTSVIDGPIHLNKH